jgi:hypothetical protein
MATKLPNDHRISTQTCCIIVKIAIKYASRPSKMYQNWDSRFANIPSGNPGMNSVVIELVPDEVDNADVRIRE